MKKLYLMCGIPGVGKSTWIQNHKKCIDGCVCVVSRDAIRFSLVPEGEEYFSREDEVYDKFVKDICAGLAAADNVIADATHLNIGSRTKLLRAVGKYVDLSDVEVNAIVLDMPLDLALERNELRKDTRAYVPRGVIRRMASSFKQPEFIEGFKKIYVYRPNGLTTLWEESNE